MPSQEALLEAEARGLLPPEKLEALTELRQRGGIMSAAEYQVRTGRNRPDYRRESSLGDSFQRFSDQVMDPLHLQDEIVGAGQFIRKLATSGKGVVNPEAWKDAGRAYTEAAERIRAERDVARADYGILPEIVGGAGTIAQTAKTVATTALPVGARILNSMKTGAGFGAAAGFGHSEGGIAERAVGTLQGAGLGAVAGPVADEIVAPLIGRTVDTVKRAARSSTEIMRDTFGDLVPALKRSADARFVRSLQRQGQTVDDAAAAYEQQLGAGKFGETQLEVPLTPADLGPATQRQGRAIATIPGRGASMAEEVYGGRQQNQFSRMNEYLARSLQVTRGDYSKTLNSLTTEMKTAAAPAYKKFYELKDARGRPVRYDVGPILRRSELKDAQLAPNLAKMMRQARQQFMSGHVIRDMGRDMNQEVLLGKDAILGRSPTYKLTGPRFDSGKQALDDMIEQAKARGQANQVRLLVQLKDDLVSTVDRESMRQAVKMQKTKVFDAKGKQVEHSFEVSQVDAKGKPVYESLYSKARDAYGGPAALKDALTAGRSFMRGDSELTAAAYKDLTTAQKQLFRLGVAREARKVLGGKALGQDMLSHFRKPNTMETLSEIMGPAKFKGFMKLVDLERGMAQSNTIIRGGSPTANKLADVEDLNAFMTMGRVLKDKGLAGAAFDAIGTIIQRTLQMREVDAHNLARLMFETNPQTVRATFARLKLLYGPKKVQTAMQLANNHAGSLMASVMMEAGQRGAVQPQAVY